MQFIKKCKCSLDVGSRQLVLFVLISDLFEGGVEAEFLKRAMFLVNPSVHFIVLLALSDEGAPSFNHELAATLATIGVPAFACTPDIFPELMAAAIRRDDIASWATARGIVPSRGETASI